MTIIYLALGSNVGDSRDYIEKAIKMLGESMRDIVRAPVYTSKAVGYTEQADFYNTAIQASTDLTPSELLQCVKSVEQQIGRIERFRWGPREIDIDIIFYDQNIVDEPTLTIPHQRFRERDFVLRPIWDIQPDFIDPVTKKSVAELLSKLPQSDLSIKNTIES